MLCNIIIKNHDIYNIKFINLLKVEKMNKEYNPLNDSFLIENKCIFKKYKPIKRIGKGSFGNIYSIVRMEDKSVFAMKTEKINTSKTLESEAYFLYTLQGFGIPKLISFGHTKKYNILIETLLGKSLHNIFFRDKRKCNIENACLIGIQLLDRLEWIHSKDIIYRDVKPENFLVGIDDPNIIYIVDFGLCKKYRSSKTGKHVLPKYTGRFNGTLLYASQYAVRGKESSRRDDLISLGYLLIYLIKRRLPWTKDFKNLNKQQYRQMLYNKESNANGELFKELPQEFIDYVEYAKKLKFEEEPDYPRLRCLFFNLLERMKINYQTLTFSWINKEEKQNNLSCIPRSNSQRKKSPFVKILKNIQERKKMSESNKNLKMNNISIVDKEKISCEKPNDVNTEIVKNNKTQRINISPLNLKIKSLKKNKKIIKNINMIPIYDKKIRGKNHSNLIGKSENNININHNEIINHNFAKSNIYDNVNVNENIINDKDDNNLINMEFDLNKNKDNDLKHKKRVTPILIRNISINYINNNSCSNMGKDTKEIKKIQKNKNNNINLIYNRKIPITYKKRNILNNITNDIIYNTPFRYYGNYSKGTAYSHKNINNNKKINNRANTYLFDYENPLEINNNDNGLFDNYFL